jgi:hypothetical protein
MMASDTPHPGLTKIRSVPLYRERRVVVVRTVAGRIRELIEAADVVSEGATRNEDGELVYFGSTSLHLRGDAMGVGPHQLAALLARDPHVRLLALRIARREISARVSTDIGTLRTELSIGVKDRVVTIDVDIVAAIARRRAGG